MGYEVFGRLHAALVGLSRERGQGTVEYVGLVLLLAVVLAGVVAASQKFNDKSLATTIMDKLKGAIDEVAPGGKK